MAKPKKIDDQTLIKLIGNYFNEMHMDTKSLKYTSISRYLKKMGLDIEEHNIRNSDAAVAYLNKLRQNDSNATLLNTIVFKTIDVDLFTEKNNSIQKLKKALIDRDNYYGQVCETANIAIKKYKSIKNDFETLNGRVKVLKNKNVEVEQQLAKIKAENVELKYTNKVLKDVLEKNVYPEIANELLKDSGLLNGGNFIVSKTGKENIISDTDSIIKTIEKNERIKSDNKLLQGLFDKI